jgi:glycosyltransferase involved in cell wall biosynthesis
LAKKILVITYYWPPSGGAGVQRILKFVKYLPQFDIEPVVLTIDEKSAFYPATDESLRNEIPKGIKVYRTRSFEPLKILSSFVGKRNIPQSGFSNRSHKGIFHTLLRFIRGNFFIPDARVGWVKHAYRAACRIIEEEKIDTVLISSPPHSTQLVGLKLKNKYKYLKWIADLRDPWTDIYYYKEMLHTQWAKSKDSKLEKEVVERADEIIVVSKPIEETFRSKATAKLENTFHVIPNGYDEEDFTGAVQEMDDAFVITYAGTIADTYNPQIFFECLRKLKATFPGMKLKLRFVGGRTENIVAIIKANELEPELELISHVSHEQAIRFMRSTNALLLVIPDVPGSKGILTGKLFEYLAARKPIINIGPADGEAAEIISECRAGRTFERNEQEAIVNYLYELVRQWNQNQHADIDDNSINKYSRRSQTEQLAAIIRN